MPVGLWSARVVSIVEVARLDRKTIFQGVREGLMEFYPLKAILACRENGITGFDECVTSAL
jgi:hypothetical protein